ncbi:MAG: hypothetical protein ABIG88_03230, partial [Patescibacteria group bacterium]
TEDASVCSACEKCVNSGIEDNKKICRNTCTGECTKCEEGSCVKKEDGTKCSTGLCEDGVCVREDIECIDNDYYCADKDECCSGICYNSSCVATEPEIECIEEGEACVGAIGDCCSGICSIGLCVAVGPPTPPTPPTPPNEETYFGYAMTGMDGIGNGNYIEEVMSFSNFITIKSTTIEKDIEKIKLVSANGAKSAVWVDHIFFNGKFNNVGQIESISLFPDYIERWNAYADKITPYINNISIFYPLDEPYWNGYNAINQVQPAQMKIMLEQVALTIKDRFEDAKLGVIFGYPAFNKNYEAYYVSERNNNFEIPSNYDYVGFDFYYAASQMHSHNLNQFKEEYNNYFSFFKSKTSSYHKIVLVPDAFYFSSAPISESEIIAVADFYYNIFKSDSSVKLFIPFLYPSIPSMIGVRDLPLVDAKYQTIGREILGK